MVVFIRPVLHPEMISLTQQMFRPTLHDAASLNHPASILPACLTRLGGITW